MLDIKFDHVSKMYKLRARSDAPRRWYRARATRANGKMWALRNISFHVQEGEALGIVGHNGAGKTTILRILSGITTPTEGEITIRGKLAALVELGSGFHPELTGIENIYVHGAMLGMRRAEIQRKLESIVEFSGVGRYIDVPVKRYSSGMFVRLGFAIAAHLDPDILLLDEVLAVGDVAFQNKCLDRIGELRRSGCTIIFISHDLAAVYRLCDRALLLHHGTVFADGLAREVVDQYQALALTEHQQAVEDGSDEIKPVECTNISFTSPELSGTIRTGFPMIARVGYRSGNRIANAVVRVSIYWPSGYLCAQLTTESTRGGVTLDPGAGVIEFQCPVLPIIPGLYRIDVAIAADNHEIDLQQRCATLRVEPGRIAYGDFFIENTWKIAHSSECTTPTDRNWSQVVRQPWTRPFQ